MCATAKAGAHVTGVSARCTWAGQEVGQSAVLHQVQLLYQACTEAVGLPLAGHHTSICNDEGCAHVQRGTGRYTVLCLLLWHQ